MKNSWQDKVMAGVCLAIGLGAVLIALTLPGCAKIKGDADVKVSGTVNHVVSVDLKELEHYFGYSCDTKAPGDTCYYPIKQDCINCMVADFLDKVVR